MNVFTASLMISAWMKFMRAIASEFMHVRE
jgi:hypothetical protein